MQTQVLTTQQLQNLCNYLVIQSENYSTEIFPMIKALHNTGLRANEVFQLDRWIVENENSASVYLEKNSGIRSISLDNLPQEFKNYLFNYPTFAPSVTIRQLQFFIRKFLGVDDIRVGNKSISTHLFRYNYIRSLYANGWTLNDIKTEIVHGSSSVTTSYLFGTIEVSGFLSPSLWAT